MSLSTELSLQERELLVFNS